MRLFAWVACALVIALVYRYTSLFDSLKARSVDLVAPLYWVSDLPAKAEDWADNRLMSRAKLIDENNTYRSDNLILNQKLQKTSALKAENIRLRELLNASEAIDDKVVIAELIGVMPDPQVHKVIINRGKNHNVYEGQAVLDAFGLMGQVVEVGDRYSIVLLVTDSSHAIPVQVDRSGVRLVAEGVGDLYRLNLRHVSNTLDIAVGDILLSSGLGQRFPAGYPVAQVTELVVDQGRPFAYVSAKPLAKLNRSRNVLLVFEQEKAN